MSETLVSRSCACGCGQTFRCMPGSPQKFAARLCEAEKTEGGLGELHRRDIKAKSIRDRSIRFKAPAGFVNSRQLSEALGLSLWMVQEWSRLGKIPCYRPGPRLVHFKVEEVRAAMKKLGLGMPSKLPEPTSEEEEEIDGADEEECLEDEDDGEISGLFEEKDETELCANPSCHLNRTKDGGLFCSKDCALTVARGERSTQSAPMASSSTTAPTAPFRKFGRDATIKWKDSGIDSKIQRSENTPTSERENTMPATLKNAEPEIEIDGSASLSNDDENSDEFDGSNSNSTDRLGMQNDETGTLEISQHSGARKSSDDENGSLRTLVESSFLPSGNLNEERSLSINLIDDTAQDLRDLMRNLKESEAGKPFSMLRTPDAINATCNVAGQIYKLMRLKLDVLKELKKG